MRALSIGVLTWSVLGSPASAQTDLAGYILGRVFEVDKNKFRRYTAQQEAKAEPEEKKAEVKLDPNEFLLPRSGIIVTARQIENNYTFDSSVSADSGDYLIRDTPTGVYEFVLGYEGEIYPVAAQRLGVKVDLNYVAELCFVIDREEKVAWMAAAGSRRAPEVPPWVPTECQSDLGACLAMLVGEDVLPDGLLLLLAGSAAAATNIGIFATEQVEASPVRKKN